MKTYARPRLALLRLGAFLVALGCFQVAHAGYAELAPPQGFSNAGGFRFATSANDTWFGRVVHQPNALRVPVPGSAVTMPASYRLASNAPRIAAGIIFANPAIRTAAGIAAWLLAGSLVWDAAEQAWKQLTEIEEGTGKEYQAVNTTQWFTSPTAACYHYISVRTSGSSERSMQGILPNGNCKVGYVKTPESGYEEVQIITRDVVMTGSCPQGWTQTPAGCVSPALNQPQFEEALDPKPMPDTVPQELPQPAPLPVEQPYINPEPGPNPAQRPLFVPTGDPVRNPNYDPSAPPSPTNQPWIQPGVRVVPSPTASQPWRVDLQPVDRPVSGPDPLPPDSEGPGQDNGGDKPKEQPDLCEKNPDVVACQKLGEADPQQRQDDTQEFTVTPATFSSSAGCPPPVSFQMFGQAYEFSYSGACNVLATLRALMLAMAAVLAAYIVADSFKVS